MAEQQVMVGYPSGHFYPQGFIDRYQMASVLQRWLVAHGAQIQENEPVVISDELPNWAAESVHYMLNSRIMAPISGHFAGDKLLNREEAAVYIYRAWLALDKA